MFKIHLLFLFSLVTGVTIFKAIFWVLLFTMYIYPVSGKDTLYCFTVANARGFYSSRGGALPLNELKL